MRFASMYLEEINKKEIIPYEKVWNPRAEMEEH